MLRLNRQDHIWISLSTCYYNDINTITRQVLAFTCVCLNMTLGIIAHVWSTLCSIHWFHQAPSRVSHKYVSTAIAAVVDHRSTQAWVQNVSAFHIHWEYLWCPYNYMDVWGNATATRSYFDNQRSVSDEPNGPEDAYTYGYLGSYSIEHVTIHALMCVLLFLQDPAGSWWFLLKFYTGCNLGSPFTNRSLKIKGCSLWKCGRIN